jgi:hypothetical protein
MSYADQVYQRAAAATGKSVEQLQGMAQTVFASMLHHALEHPGDAIWTVTDISGSDLYVEVNIPARVRRMITVVEKQLEAGR